MSKKTPLPEPGTGAAVASWVEKELVERIDELASELKVSRSTVVREIVMNYFDKQNKTISVPTFPQSKTES